MQFRRPSLIPGLGRSFWKREGQPTPVFLPEESNGWRSLAGYSPWGFKELDTTEQLIWEVGKVCSNPSSAASLIFLATTASYFCPGPIYRQIDPLASNNPTVKFYFSWYFFPCYSKLWPKKRKFLSLPGFLSSQIAFSFDQVVWKRSCDTCGFAFKTKIATRLYETSVILCG